MPICITFAGVPGSSKTPIAHYISWNLGLPIHNNDAMRTEVIEDLGSFNQSEYINRRDNRNKLIVERDVSFIYDASVDRQWPHLKALLGNDYHTFIISLDLSQPFTEKLYQAKGYTEGANLPRFHHDHRLFLESYDSIVNLHLSDREFPDRLELSLKAVQAWLKTLA